jgi:hypothetical protein
MHIAQIAPLTEAVPPKLYGGTERVIHWLTDALVALGHEVTLFASGDSRTAARLDPAWPRAIRHDESVRDPNALHMMMLERARFSAALLQRRVSSAPYRSPGSAACRCASLQRSMRWIANITMSE